MACQNLVKRFGQALVFASSLAMMTSCSDNPLPGSLSPGGLTEQQIAPQRTPGRVLPNGIKPVKAKVDGAIATVKGGYAIASTKELLLALEDLSVEIRRLAASTSDRSLARELKYTYYNAVHAQKWLSQAPPEYGEARLQLLEMKFRLIKLMLFNWKSKSQFEDLLDRLIPILEEVRREAYNACRGTKGWGWINWFTGGTVQYCGHEIQVPAGALKESTEMTIAVKKGEDIVVDFGPDGWFNKPVTVVLNIEAANLEGLNPKKLLLAWYDKEAGVWYGVETQVDLENLTLTAQVWHFTQYTLSVE